MVAIGNHTYQLGIESPNETKRVDVLYGVWVWAMIDALGFA